MTLGKSGRPAPWTIIGYHADGRPIHLMAGGSADEDDDTGLDLDADGAEEEDEEETDAEGDGEDEAEAEKPKPKAKPAAKPAVKAPTAADLERVTGALAKEREAAKDARAKLRDSLAENRTLKKAAEPKTGDDEVVVKAVEAARAEEQDRFKPLFVGKAARLALVAAGLPADTPESSMKRLLKMIEVADVDVDEDGEVAGLDDQIDQIKEALPLLFAKPEPEAPAPKLRAPKLDVADRKNQAPKPRTTGEIHAAQILAGGG